MESDEIRDELKRLGDLIRKLIENSQPPPAAGEFLSVKEVADRLGVSTGTVYNLVVTRQLLASRIGKGRGTLRFDPADLKDFQAISAGVISRRRGR
jgi:excisionase family DNA binding protein